jgi:hypothetical protein
MKLETVTKELCKQYCDELKLPYNATNFPGVELVDLNQVSDVFKVGINVYKQESDGTTEMIYKTVQRDNIMHLHLFSNHFSYITDLDKFSKSFRCEGCNKLWKKFGNYKRHTKTCDVNVKFRYGCGVFRVKRTIFEQLEEEGIVIPQDLRFFPFYATFDIESILKKDVSIPDSNKVHFTAEHELVSVSVCSNVLGYEKPVCFISEGDGQVVVQKMVSHLNKISEASLVLMLDLYKPYLDVIKDNELKAKFESYLEELPVLSFNGGMGIVNKF